MPLKATAEMGGDPVAAVDLDLIAPAWQLRSDNALCHSPFTSASP